MLFQSLNWAPLKTDKPKVPTDWSHDGRYIVYNDGRATGAAADLWALPLSGDRKPIRITASRFDEYAARISPDGRWIAHLSNESEPNQPQIYIQSFPQPGAKQQISTKGGYQPRWSRDGKELFYLAPDATLMAVSIKSAGPSLEAGVPAALFKAPFILAGLSGRRDYDVSADGRFPLNITAPAEVLPTPITVILNWAAGLKRNSPQRRRRNRFGSAMIPRSNLCRKEGRVRREKSSQENKKRRVLLGE